MKAIKIIYTTMLLTCLGACTSNTTEEPTTNQEPVENEAVKVAVELIDKTEYTTDSSFKMIYQVDKTTGAKYGIYKEYDVETSTLLIERNYNDNKLDGVEKIYFPNGQVDGELTYKDGVHDGVFKYYYEDGTLKQQGNYVNGSIEGILNSYYPTGTLKEEVTHVEGVTQGAFKEYNEDGTLKAEGEYTSKSGQENLEEGELKMYDERGTLVRKMICKEGQCCTIWTLEDGEVEPKTKLCKAILSSQSS